MTDAHLSVRADKKESAAMKPEVFLPDDYRPAEDEPFMNDRQLEYFRRKLIVWKQELLDQSSETIENLQDSARNVPDLADRASEETDRALELRTRDRQRKLVAKIDAALRRIENGEYGYCEMTGEPISLKRLDARPIATMTLKPRKSTSAAKRCIATTEFIIRVRGCAGRSGGRTWAGRFARPFPFRGSAMTLIGQTVTVLGAGVAGLAVARALALRGAQVTVLEQADAIREVGAGLQVSPNGAAVLKALGLGAALQAAAMRAEAVELRDGLDGSLVTRLEVARLRPDQGYHFLHRADLVGLLLDGARDAGVELRLLQNVETVDLSGERPRLLMSTGAVVEPALLVGADGLHSATRVALNGKVAPFFTHQVAWRTLIPCEPGAPPWPRCTWGRGGTLSAIRCAAAPCATSWRSRSAAAGWKRAGPCATTRWNCGWPSKALARGCAAGCSRSRMSTFGVFSAIPLQNNGLRHCRRAPPRSWAMPRTPRCRSWRRAPAWA